MIDKEIRANLALGLLGLVLAGFSTAVMLEQGGEMVAAFFRKPMVANIAELFAVELTLEAEVAGFLDPQETLVETSHRRGSTEVAWHRYYYALYDQQPRTAGIYVYSELDPISFVQQYGSGRLVLRGIWEDTPGNIRTQEAMSHVGEQLRELAGRGVATGGFQDILTPLAAYRQRHPLRIDRRLNLNPARWKVEKAFALAGSMFFFVAGLSMLWIGIKRQYKP